MKNTYLVTLRLFIGCYEKHTKHLVEAIDEEQAMQLALENESHNDDAGNDESMQWCDDDMRYEVDDCQLVPWDDAVVLRKYL